MDLPTGYFIITLGLSSIGCFIAGVLISNLFGISLIRQSGDSERAENEENGWEDHEEELKMEELVPHLIQEEIANLYFVQKDAHYNIYSRLKEEHGDKLSEELERGPQSFMHKQELENPYFIKEATDYLAKVRDLFQGGDIGERMYVEGSKEKAKEYLDNALSLLSSGMEKWGEDVEVRASIGESLSHLYKIRDKYMKRILE
jgi:hypothetical protein